MNKKTLYDINDEERTDIYGVDSTIFMINQ